MTKVVQQDLENRHNFSPVTSSDVAQETETLSPTIPVIGKRDPCEQNR